MNSDLLEPFQKSLEEPVSREDYENVLKSLIKLLGAERGCFWLERENKFLYEGDEELRKSFPFSRQAVDAVLQKGRSFLSFHPENDPRIAERSSLSVNVRSCIAASCLDENRNFLVVAYFDRKAKSGQFDHGDLKNLKAVLSLVPGAEPVA